MRHLGILCLGLAFAFTTIAGLPTRAEAKGKGAGIDKVLGACKRTAGCHFDSDGPGEATGCSPNTCFICHNSKCIAVIKGNTKGTSLGGIRLPPGTVKSASGGTNSGGNSKPIKHPVKTGASNPPTSVNSPVASGKGGGMNQGGGHHR